VANIYDVSGRLYLLKLSKANRKEHLLIESGIRIHTTKYVKNQKDLPSGFSMKLRKHLRTKKLDKIEQLGVDRVIDLTFGKSENAYHILVELYASGNVILTDHEYTILSLLRSHKFEENATIAVK
jgi:predicted ribosome quality control (RQC) complex YloA/Tae2 family protein